MTRVVTLLRAVTELRATILPNHLVLVQVRGSTAAVMKKHANDQRPSYHKTRGGTNTGNRLSLSYHITLYQGKREIKVISY
jgi:hypothetical protein